MAIVDRIRKMLQVAQHNTSVEEAATAAAMAQELMFKYQIRAEDLVVPETPPEPVEDGEVLKSGRYETWKGRLLVYLASSFGASVYTETGVTIESIYGDPTCPTLVTEYRRKPKTNYRVVGLASVVQTVQYMAAYLINEIDGLAQREYDANGSGNAKTWKNNFRLGAVQVIGNRLNQRRREQVAEVKQQVQAAKDAGQDCLALALYQTDQLRQEEAYKKVIKEKRLYTRAEASSRYDRSAFDQGRDAGSKLSLGGGPALGTPKKEIQS